MDIGQKIKRIRKEKHISAETLAERIGISAASMYRYENGDISKMPTSTLAKIADVLDTTPAYLMGWDNHPTQIQHSADLDDDEAILTYQGKPLSDEDKEMIRRIMRGK